jgi:hypothetical protein
VSTFLRLRAVALTVALALPSSAWADVSDKAAAIAAFDEAAEFMRSGEVASACAKYQESYTLDPQLGTLLHLGYCQEQLARLASAWLAFRDAADWAKKVDDKRQGVAEQRAKMLEPRLSRLQLTVPTNLPSGTTIRRNGNVIPSAVFRSAMPLDLGSYEITVSAPGHQTWTSTIELTKEGQVLNLGIPTLQKLPEPLAPPEAETSPEEPERSLGSRKWPAFVAGGVAVAGGVVWGVFGVQSMQTKAEAQQATGLGQWLLQEKAYEQGTIATVGMIATGVGAVAAITLWAVLPGRKASSPQASESPVAWQLQVGPSHVQLGGTF